LCAKGTLWEGVSKVGEVKKIKVCYLNIRRKPKEIQQILFLQRWGVKGT
jgi:hypothetical protein